MEFLQCSLLITSYFHRLVVALVFVILVRRKKKANKRDSSVELMTSNSSVAILNDKEIITGEKLGEGSFGAVYKASWNGTACVRIVVVDSH